MLSEKLLLHIPNLYQGIKPIAEKGGGKEKRRQIKKKKKLLMYSSTKF